MTTLKLSEKTKFVFLPTFLMAVLLNLCMTIFYFVGNSIISSIMVANPSQVPYLKTLSYIPEAILAVALFFVSKYPFEKVFKYTLLTLIAIMAILTGLLAITEIHPLYYIAVRTMSMHLAFFLIWGFINRISNISDGMKYYIPLTFVLGLIAGLTTMLISGIILGFMTLVLPDFDKNLQLLTVYIGDRSLITAASSAIVLTCFTLLVFHWAWKRLPDSLLSPKTIKEPSTPFPYLSAAYLLASSFMVQHILNLLLKTRLAEIKNAGAYSTVMSSYSITTGVVGILFFILWAIVGTMLLIKKGWRTTAISGAASIIAGGALYFASTISAGPTDWLYVGLYNTFFVATSASLFVPLIQILYLSLPAQIRLRAKVITEMIAMPLMTGIPSLAVLITTSALYLKILVVVFLILLIVATKRLVSKGPGSSIALNS